MAIANCSQDYVIFAFFFFRLFLFSLQRQVCQFRAKIVGYFFFRRFLLRLILRRLLYLVVQKEARYAPHPTKSELPEKLIHVTGHNLEENELVQNG